MNKRKILTKSSDFKDARGPLVPNDFLKSSQKWIDGCGLIHHLTWVQGKKYISSIDLFLGGIIPKQSSFRSKKPLMINSMFKESSTVK